MGDLTRNFSRKEFQCRCGCGLDTVDVQLMGILQLDLRDYYKAAVTISSGCRCFTHNMAENGARDSLHIVGKAADVIVEGVPSIEVYTRLNEMYPDMLGLGAYDNVVHIDARATRARWNKTTLYNLGLNGILFGTNTHPAR